MNYIVTCWSRLIQCPVVFPSLINKYTFEEACKMYQKLSEDDKFSNVMISYVLSEKEISCINQKSEN